MLLSKAILGANHKITIFYKGFRGLLCLTFTLKYAMMEGGEQKAVQF